MDERAKALLRAWPSATPALKKSIAARIVELQERTKHGGPTIRGFHTGGGWGAVGATPASGSDKDDHFYGAWNAGGGGRGGPRTPGQARALGRNQDHKLTSHGAEYDHLRGLGAATAGEVGVVDARSSHGLLARNKYWDTPEAHLERKIGPDGIVAKMQKVLKPPPGAPATLDESKLMRLGGGISQTWTYTENGKKWVVKNSKAAGKSSTGVRNELATAVVNDGMGGFMTMPKIYPAKVKGDVVSVSEFLSDAKVARLERYAPKLGGKADLDVFDYVVNNGDRHRGNWMVKPDGTIVAIDHDITFLQGAMNLAPHTLSPHAVDALKMLKSNQQVIDLRLKNLGVDTRTRQDVFQRTSTLLNRNAGVEEVDAGIPTSQFAKMAAEQFALDNSVDSMQDAFERAFTADQIG